MGINREHVQFTHAGAESVRDKIKEIGLASQSTASAMDGLKGTVIALAGAYVGLQGIKTTTNAIKEFESTMLEVKAVTRATTEDYNLLSKSARDLGASTRYSASEAGQAILALSRNGFTVNETLVSVEDSLNLAIAGVLGLQQAADITASTVRQFGLDASEAGRVTDVLVLAANNASTTVAQFSEAMSYAGTAAAAANQSLEEASGVIQVLANNNIRGSMAGTNYRSMLLSLLNPTEKARDALESMGLTAEDVSIKTHKFHEVFGILKNAGLDLTTAAQIFDERSATAAVTLANFNGQIEKYVQQNKNAAGAAKEAASVMDSGLKQGFLELESVIEEAMLRLGDGGFGGALNGLIIGLGDAVKLLFHFEGAMEDSSTQGKILASVLGAITAAATISSMNSLVGMTVKLGIALKTAFNAHPILMMIGAVGSLVGAIVPLIGHTDKMAAAMKEAESNATDQVAEFNLLVFQYENLAKKVNRTTAEETEFNKIITQLKKEYPEHLGNISLEKGLTEDVTKALKEQKTELVENIALKMKQAELSGIAEKQLEISKEITLLEKARDAWAFYYDQISKDPKASKGYSKKGFGSQADELKVASEGIKSYQEDINEAQNKINSLQKEAESITNEYGIALKRLVNTKNEDLTLTDSSIDSQSALNKVSFDALLISETQSELLEYQIEKEIEFQEALERGKTNWENWMQEMESKQYDWKPAKPQIEDTESGLPDELQEFNKRKELYDMEVEYYTQYRERLFNTEAEYQAKLTSLKEQYGIKKDEVISVEKTKENLDENSQLLDIFADTTSQTLGDLFTGVASDFESFMNSLTSAIIRAMTNNMVTQFFGMLSGIGGDYSPPDVAKPATEAVYPLDINRRELGGSYEAGVPRITGERGWEIDVPSVNGRVLSHSDAMKAVSGGGQPVNVKILNNVDEGMILQALQTNAGEKLIMNTIMKHKNMIGGY